MTQTIDRTYRRGKRANSVRYVPGRFAPSSTDPRWSQPATSTERAVSIYRPLGASREQRRRGRRMIPNGAYGGGMNVPATRTILGLPPRVGRHVRRVGA